MVTAVYISVVFNGAVLLLLFDEIDIILILQRGIAI